ncbi:MAG TPA: hypothetical protein VMB79_15385 [Jatrophihabitans sp.]|nr:hypothetical protein [Jatrophihabitans sp.]
MEELLRAVEGTAPRCGAVRVIAVDGGAASGKTTLAGRLAAALPDCAVVHLDDLLDGWAGQFGYRDRLHAELLAPLADGRAGSYLRYDWAAGRFGDRVAVAPPRHLVVEGVSAIWGCAPYWSAAAHLAVGRAERERRWAERDGPPQPEWRAWLDAEDRFFAEHPVPAGATILRSRT